MQSPQSSQHAKTLERKEKRDTEGKVIESSVTPGQLKHICVALRGGRAGPKPVNQQMFSHYDSFIVSHKSSTGEK